MSEHSPRYRYDCGRYKFNWNCGLLCACVLPASKYSPPPKSRDEEVKEAQRQWCERRAAIVQLDETAKYLSNLVNGGIDSGLPPEILKRAEDIIAPLDNLADDIGRFKHPEERDR